MKTVCKTMVKLTPILCDKSSKDSFVKDCPFYQSSCEYCKLQVTVGLRTNSIKMIENTKIEYT